MTELKEKIKKIESQFITVLLIILLVILTMRILFPLFLPTKYITEDVIFTSVKKLEGRELESFIQTSENILESVKGNPFYKDNKKIIVCFHNNKVFYSILALSKSIGCVMNLGNISIMHFSETNFITKTITGMSKEYNVRNIEDSLTHEFNHIFLSTGFSFLDFLLVPTWKNEGISECIVSSSSYDIEKGVENFFLDIKDNSHQYDYFKYRLAVMYLTKARNYTYEDILKSRNLKFKDVLAEIKEFSKEEVLSWYSL